MANRITVLCKQKHEQSCNALAILITLKEFGKPSAYDGTEGCETTLWESLRRSATAGKQEIMPHRTYGHLVEKGLNAEVFEDTGRTAPLKVFARDDYDEYTLGIASASITLNTSAIDPATALDDDARLFLIVGFLQMGSLKTHTILARKDGGKIWVFNPDGGTDTEYTGSAFSSFLSASLLTSASLPNAQSFANRDYLYTGIAIRVTA